MSAYLVNKLDMYFITWSRWVYG